MWKSEILNWESIIVWGEGGKEKEDIIKIVIGVADRIPEFRKHLEMTGHDKFIKNNCRTQSCAKSHIVEEIPRWILGPGFRKTWGSFGIKAPSNTSNKPCEWSSIGNDNRNSLKYIYILKKSFVLQDFQSAEVEFSS